MGKIANIRLSNITEALKATDVFAVYRDGTWIPVQGLRFDDLIFGDPTILDGNFQVNGNTIFNGDMRKASLTENEWLTVDASGNIVSSGNESLDYYTSALLDAGQLDNRYYTETEADTLIGNGVLKCIENEVTVSSDDQLVRYEELCMGTGGEIIMELGASVIVGV